MGKVADSKFIGGRIPIELHDEILRRAKEAKISKSVYAEAIFNFWDSLGRPDLDGMKVIAFNYGGDDADASKPTQRDLVFIDRIDALDAELEILKIDKERLSERLEERNEDILQEAEKRLIELLAEPLAKLGVYLESKSEDTPETEDKSDKQAGSKSHHSAST